MSGLEIVATDLQLAMAIPEQTGFSVEVIRLNVGAHYRKCRREAASNPRTAIASATTRREAGNRKT
jgi:hypothetical protein